MGKKTKKQKILQKNTWFNTNIKLKKKSKNMVKKM